MLRRSFLELSSRQFFRRKPTWSTTQIPSFLSSRKQYSVAPQKNASQGPGSTGKPSEPGSPLPKFIVGGLVLGGAFVGYHFGEQYIQELRSAVVSAKLGTNDPPELSKRVKDLQEDKHLGDQNVMSSTRESNVSIPTTEPAEENIETHSDLLNGNEGEIRFQEKDVIQSKPEEEVTPVQETEFPSSTQSSMTSDDESKTSTTSLEERFNIKNTEVKPSTELHEAVESKPVLNQGNSNAEEKSVAPQLQTATDVPEDAVSVGVKQQPNSILDEYYLRNKVEAPTSTSSDEQKDVVGAIEDSSDVFISKDGKLVLDFLQAIHAAEKRQAELDAHFFFEEKRKMKEKYEKELKDARVRELMYAEEAAILDKELNRERLKAAAALKSLQEELEEKIKMELEQMEAEAELKLKKIQELAKAELAAAIASEKASQIEKMAEANLHINALCMAFYARSEQARQSHSVHKLALGTLALEDALSKGLPFQKEIDALHTYLEGVDKDPLLDLVLSSLPEETQSSGTDTVLQLKRKFDALKGTLRPFSLIPPGGGGILAHSVAQVASWLKVREADQSGDGIESLINMVESFLAEGKLSEAADTLENGVKGTKAAEVIGEWLQLARNRAITEQALTLLQSYATSISVT